MESHTNSDSSSNIALGSVFITGIAGQDGSYLTELLLGKGYFVHGLIRRRLANDQLGIVLSRLEGKGLTLHIGDVTDATRLAHLIKQIRPLQVYNLAAISHVSTSFQMPSATFSVNTIGTINLLEAIKAADMMKSVRFYQASTSEMFGNATTDLQDRKTLFDPVSPYAIAKLAAHQMVRSYREGEGMFAVCGILFNHESPRRGKGFVTRRISQKVAQIHLHEAKVLKLANLDSTRDWGHAREYVEAMWLMLQQKAPEDVVIATGRSHTVREFVEAAFQAVDIVIRWEVSEGGKEQGYGSKTSSDDDGWMEERLVVLVDPKVEAMRSTKVKDLCGDPTQAEQLLNWKSRCSLESIALEMVRADIDLLRKEKRLQPLPRNT